MTRSTFLIFAISIAHLVSAQTNRGDNRNIRGAETKRIATSTFCLTSYCLNGSNCGTLKCAGCEFTCSNQCNLKPKGCAPWCKPEDCGKGQGCDSCLSCKPRKKKTCSLGTFTDVTEQMFSKNETYWYQAVHSGMPYKDESSPLLVDLDGDNVLDYFDSLHGHRIDSEELYLNNRMELALTKKSNSASNDKTQYLDPIGDRRMFEDDPDDYDSNIHFIDPHGQNIVDLDGDGILDLYIASGGFSGLPAENAAVFDNFLLFGEKTANGDTIFRGGRTQAQRSGVHAR